MRDLIVSFLPFVILIVIFLVVSRRHGQTYKDYLAKHSAETTKMADEQRAKRAAIERQTNSLGRVAVAVENRAMFFLMGLPPDLNLLIVEKGGHIPHEVQIATLNQNPERFTQTNHADHPKDWVAHTLFGGTSNFW